VNKATDTKTCRMNVCRSEATRAAFDGRFHADAAKDLVMSYVGRFVSDGLAEWQQIESGDIRLRFHTGETFILSDTAMSRIA
jgi:hypothetical protein